MSNSGIIGPRVPRSLRWRVRDVATFNASAIEQYDEISEGCEAEYQWDPLGDDRNKFPDIIDRL